MRANKNFQAIEYDEKSCKCKPPAIEYDAKRAQMNVEDTTQTCMQINRQAIEYDIKCVPMNTFKP